MKKYIAIILIVFLLGSVCFGTAYADADKYFEIKNENVFLYSRDYDFSTNSFSYKKLFDLPISYYATVLNNPDTLDSNYVWVAYNGKEGWVPVSSVGDMVSDIANPYFAIKDLTVVSKVSLYEDTASSTVKMQLEENTSLNFISYLKIDDTTYWYYVKTADGTEGYVRAAHTNHQTLPFVRYDSSAATDTDKVPENKPKVDFFNNLNNNLLNWILSILILIPTVTFVILIFKRKKTETSKQRNEQLNFSESQQNGDKDDSQIYINK